MGIKPTSQKGEQNFHFISFLIFYYNIIYIFIRQKSSSGTKKPRPQKFFQKVSAEKDGRPAFFRLFSKVGMQIAFIPAALQNAGLLENRKSNICEVLTMVSTVKKAPCRMCTKGSLPFANGDRAIPESVDDNPKLFVQYGEEIGLGRLSRDFS